MRPVLAVPRAINQAISKYYAPGMREEGAAVAATETAPKAGGKPASKSEKPKKETATAKPTGKSAPLSQEQKRERLLLTAIFGCWSTIGTIAGLYFANGQVVSFLHVVSGAVAGLVVFGTLKLTWAR